MMEIFIVECILKPLKNQFMSCFSCVLVLGWKASIDCWLPPKTVVFFLLLLFEAGDPDN